MMRLGWCGRSVRDMGMILDLSWLEYRILCASVTVSVIPTSVFYGREFQATNVGPRHCTAKNRPPR